MLGDPSAAEREILGAIPYQPNEAVLHTDASLMPRRRAAWSSWNFHLAEEPAPGVTVTYWMNNLQRLRSRRQYFVTLNRGTRNRPGEGDPHDHLRPPRLHRGGRRRPGPPRRDQRPARRTHYCGAYWGWGFHEDGVVSAQQVCKSILSPAPEIVSTFVPPPARKGVETTEEEVAA